jgi:hypothetical protein
MVETLLPAVAALDQLARRDHGVLPALGQFVWDARRFELGLRTTSVAGGPQLVEVQFCLDSAFATITLVEEAAQRSVAAIAGPFRADVDEWIQSIDRIRDRVVNTAKLDVDSVERRLLSLIEAAVGQRAGAGAPGAILRYNMAREFPLKNAVLSRFFHIYRRSVRNLLRTFERRNGVRLWCSVRRSGKTTACFDLGGTTAGSVVVTQTCANTEGRPEASSLYDRVIAAIQQRDHLPPDFFPSVVEACGPGRKLGEGRFVVVLDEYEYLFEQLRLASEEDERIEYAVAQPLLNQLVAFSRENLLILIGQQPDAHYILMDKNQLSAYVEADHFPLFSPGDDGDASEFRLLIRKALFDQIPFDWEFEKELYEETGGHPYLTVNVLVELVEWLIQRKVSLSSFQLDRQQWQWFRQHWLTRDRLATTETFAFFRQTAAEALGMRGRTRTPWLNAQYWLLRQIARESNDTFKVSEGEASGLLQIVGTPDHHSSEELLSTGHAANFLSIQDGFVTPRVRLLSRLAEVVRPRD